ncbi:hypothetical protein I305_03272 [Cryptococcus gattii E566]|uniref:Uncharacterized protein n=1 Tax=Cryptococcus gattii serotype B (strain WM276 / ATCC MYA-4071) TaxID=367775 RepID=E6QYW5_CRYGW|nr:Hypothetical Protein CGB_A0130C [Cryptococcus gattii WM276]ADV19368.1 Hypothetical Protein CGB_A0130C [Cryptococcus gattii WM276]KIY34488.1 hypothetical protein I305_03272 [Cryptococcus gattii E566]
MHSSLKPPPKDRSVCRQFAALDPVRDIILDHLCNIAPTTTILVNKHCYKRTVPVLYEKALLSPYLLYGITCGDREQYLRTANALQHVRALEIDDMRCMAFLREFSIPPLTDSAPFPIEPQDILGGVERLEMPWTVLHFRDWDSYRYIYQSQGQEQRMLNVDPTRLKEVVLHVDDDDILFAGMSFKNSWRQLGELPKLITYIFHITASSEYEYAFKSLLQYDYGPVATVRVILRLTEDITYKDERKWQDEFGSSVSEIIVKASQRRLRNHGKLAEDPSRWPDSITKLEIYTPESQRIVSLVRKLVTKQDDKVWKYIQRYREIKDVNEGILEEYGLSARQMMIKQKA